MITANASYGYFSNVEVRTGKSVRSRRQILAHTRKGCQHTYSPSSSYSENGFSILVSPVGCKSKRHTAAIVGGVVGGIMHCSAAHVMFVTGVVGLGLLIAIIGIVLIRKHPHTAAKVRA